MSDTVRPTLYRHNRLCVEDELVFFNRTLNALHPLHLTMVLGDLKIIGFGNMNAVPPLFLGDVAGRINSFHQFG